MSNVYIPDARMTMPELFYPNRKPVGNVKLDVSHRLAPDRLCTLLGGGAVDLVSNRPLISHGSVSTIIEGDGIAARFKNIDAGVGVDSYYAIDDLISYGLGSSWTITWTGRINPLDTSATVFAGRGREATNYIQMRTGDTFRVSSPTSTHTAPRIAFNLWDKLEINSLVFVGGGFELYKKGLLIYKQTTQDVSDFEINSIGSAYNTTGFKLDGALSLFYVHSYPLSPSNVKDLHDKPYDFLIPA